jgi:hypothetical protein
MGGTRRFAGCSGWTTALLTSTHCGVALRAGGSPARTRERVARDPPRRVFPRRSRGPRAAQRAGERGLGRMPGRH